MNEILDTKNFAPLNSPPPDDGTNYTILEIAIFVALIVLLFSY